MIRKIIIITIILIVNDLIIFSQTVRLKTLELNSISTLGICYSEYDTINQGLYDSYFVVFKNVFKNNLSDAGIKKIVFLDDTVSFESLNKSDIENICTKNNLDAFLISKIYFLRNSFIYKSFLNLKEIEGPSMITGKPDIYMELKVFNRNGELILWTDTKVQTGNSSMVGPEWTINKGLKTTLKKIKKTKITVANNAYSAQLSFHLRLKIAKEYFVNWSSI